MSNHLKSILQVVVSISLAVLILYLVFSKIDWDDFWEKASNANYNWVIFSMVISILSYWLRAYRWNILLEASGYRPTTFRTLVAVLSGYLANLAIPRLGELTRCAVLKKSDNIPVPTSLGSVVNERLVDVLTLLVLTLLALIFEGSTLLTFFQQVLDLDSAMELVPLLIMLMLLGLGTLAVLWFFRKKILKSKVGAVLIKFWEGIVSIKNLERPAEFVILSILIWLVYYVMAYTVVFALPETSHLDFGAGLLLLVTGGVAFALPVQNGFGTYHALIAALLSLYAIDHNTGVFLATLLHSSQLIALIIYGSIGLILSFILFRKNDSDAA